MRERRQLGGGLRFVRFLLAWTQSFKHAHLSKSASAAAVDNCKASATSSQRVCSARSMLAIHVVKSCSRLEAQGCPCTPPQAKKVVNDCGHELCYNTQNFTTKFSSQVSTSENSLAVAGVAVDERFVWNRKGLFGPCWHPQKSSTFQPREDSLLMDGGSCWLAGLPPPHLSGEWRRVTVGKRDRRRPGLSRTGLLQPREAPPCGQRPGH